MGYVSNIVSIIEGGFHYVGNASVVWVEGKPLSFFRGMLEASPMSYRHERYTVKEDHCAAYVLIEIHSGMVYVGSSEEVYSRVSKHKFQMKRKFHDNAAFTELLHRTWMSDYDLMVVFTSDREEAYRIEQGLIDHFKDTGRLLNYGQDVHRAMLGKNITEEHKEKIRQGNLGKIVSETSRQRMRESRSASEAAQKQFLGVQAARRRPLLLNGVLYASVSEAVRATGMAESSIHKQLRKNGGKEGDGPYILNYVRSSSSPT